MALVPSEVDEQATYERLQADPSIAVGDLEAAINKYCAGIGYRNLDELCKVVTDASTGWKSSAKSLEVLNFTKLIECL